jgi:hypothetical protein
LFLARPLHYCAEKYRPSLAFHVINVYNQNNGITVSLYYRKTINTVGQGGAMIFIFPNDRDEIRGAEAIRWGIGQNDSLRVRSALFRAVADAASNKQDFERFAERFAYPWADIEKTATMASGEFALFVSKASQKDYSGQDYFEEFREKLIELRMCINLWDLVVEENESSLRDCISWRPDETGQLTVYFDRRSLQAENTGDRAPEVIASATVNPNWFEMFKPGERLGPAFAYLTCWVNAQLSRWKVRPTIAWSPEVLPSLQFVPTNFWAALWLQFAMSVSEGKAFAKCKECGTWFEVTAKAGRKSQGRSTRMYCSDSCKAKAHAARMRQLVHKKEKADRSTKHQRTRRRP